MQAEDSLVVNVETEPDLVTGTSSESSANETTSLLKEITGEMDDPLKCTNKDATPDMGSFALIVALFSGVLFGVFMEKGRVFEPLVIFDQMIFSRFIMMKMWMMALATSLFVTALLAIFPSTAIRLAEARSWSIPSFRGGLAVFVGDFIMGVGMTISGACPGSIMIQLGAGVTNAILGIFAGLLAALVFHMFAPFLTVFLDFLKPPFGTWDLIVNFAFRKAFKKDVRRIPFIVIAFTASVVLTICGIVVEILFPWRGDVYISKNPTYGMTTPLPSWLSFLSDRAWPPLLVGVGIGLLQFGLILTHSTQLGSASTYAVLASHVGRYIYPGNKQFEGLSKGTVGNWSQPFFLFGGVLGGLISAILSGTWNTAISMSWYRTIIGGFLIVFGARVAGGCTSGHGISGNSVLSIMSFIGTIGMYIGGIGTGFVIIGIQYITNTMYDW